MKFILGLVLVALSFAGCATTSSNMRVGSDMSHIDIEGQRAAAKGVQVIQADATSDMQLIGTIDASRCHRMATETAPTDAQVLSDLKIAAYAKGADAIVTPIITKESGLSSNCWFILTGKADAYSKVN